MIKTVSIDTPNAMLSDQLEAFEELQETARQKLGLPKSKVLCPFMAAFKLAQAEEESRKESGNTATEKHEPDDLELLSPQIGQAAKLLFNPLILNDSSKEDDSNLSIDLGASSQLSAKYDITSKDVEDALSLSAELADPDYEDTSDHFVSRIKRVRNSRHISLFTEEEIAEEKRIRQQQLSKMFEMISNEPDRFGVTSLSEIEHQLALYT
ncbi:unnamed protein product [Protopolystoma xenopodis]|uniref:Matrix-remodeling-associated protein 7 helical domain-containing protein n=1 Tax=Protopolystoma xenopodis TaxID=117903 RepID=A0A448XD47_9PLAT|nr:unnamed protein product [Protopolystoma xenopodis]